MTLALACAAAMLGALVVYALLGGADFGGGVWDLLASGPRRHEQRALVERAIGPVWEANHVWLIIVVVILFTAFPPAFAAAGTALHVPLTLMLLGVVLRGTSFTFRHYDSDGAHAGWGRVFAIASAVTPVLLGVVLGAVTSGRLRFAGDLPVDGFVRPWLEPFPWFVGLFTLALFAMLAAVYLTVEARDPLLVEDFRRRALAAAVAVGLSALAAALAAGALPSGFGARLLGSWWSLPLQLATGASAVTVFAALALRRFQLARFAAAAQVTLIVCGWGLAQLPYVIAPDFTVEGAAAPATTLRLLLLTLGAGALVLVPSLLYLMRVFKSRGDGAPLDDEY